ncbi:DsbC family protein [Lysobacter solisilvae (ex Woo and Kim 2020)]|uniref:Thiol:disulfide interchange protein n=1 Tax=Agrilutibacter terrestris TaxID=2865112 RepID=A0A7H0FZC7_9GAMM|nr:DsbC family protein [Lysobacter terrestris]QNP41393.1 DsbC family protein [Lysobacter terrestris]
MKRVLFALLGAISLSACAQGPQSGGDVAKAPGAQAASANKAAPIVTGRAPNAAANTPEARAIAAVRSLNPRVEIDKVRAAPIPGFREAIVQGQVVYVSDDGRYLFLPGPQGALYDTTTKTDLSEQSLAAIRKDLIKAIPVSERIVFAPPNPKYTVSIFTDVECGYCRKLHSEIAEYNRQGIAIQYMAFPRMGIGSEDHKKMISVWCAPDRKKALTDAKNDRPVPARDCKNTVSMQYDIGQRAGLTGTPMIIAEDGSTVGGYLPPQRLREALDKLAQGGEAAPAGATDPVAATGG